MNPADYSELARSAFDQGLVADHRARRWHELVELVASRSLLSAGEVELVFLDAIEQLSRAPDLKGAVVALRLAIRMQIKHEAEGGR